jgi:hypothetical protein
VPGRERTRAGDPIRTLTLNARRLRSPQKVGYAMRRLSSKLLLTASFVLGFHSPSLGVPPPPPSQADLVKLQEFIGGLVNADDAHYLDSLADDVTVIQDGALVARSKVEWRKSVWSHLTGGPDHTVRVERVFYGTSAIAKGPLIFKAILV